MYVDVQVYAGGPSLDELLYCLFTEGLGPPTSSGSGLLCLSLWICPSKGYCNRWLKGDLAETSAVMHGMEIFLRFSEYYSQGVIQQNCWGIVAERAACTIIGLTHILPFAANDFPKSQCLLLWHLVVAVPSHKTSCDCMQDLASCHAILRDPGLVSQEDGPPETTCECAMVHLGRVAHSLETTPLMYRGQYARALQHKCALWPISI